MNWRSQIGQDKWVCELLHHKTRGYFIDAGAFDGETISNTYVLEKDYAWDGICIEAGRDNFAKLMSCRDVLLLNRVLNNRDGWVNFIENHTVGTVSDTGIPVMGITFSTLLKQYHVPEIIDYISLDIEGKEYDVLTDFPFDNYRVNCWTIEHNAHTDGGDVRERIYQLMKKNNYVREESGHGFEDWYVNKYLY
jgi:FkbM family methyltransferase